MCLHAKTKRAGTKTLADSASPHLDFLFIYERRNSFYRLKAFLSLSASRARGSSRKFCSLLSIIPNGADISAHLSRSLPFGILKHGRRMAFGGARPHVRAVSGWDSPSRRFLHKRWKQNYNYSTPLENKGWRAEMSDCGASSNRGRWLTFTSKKFPRRKTKLRRRCSVGKFKATLHTCFILKCISQSIDVASLF